MGILPIEDEPRIRAFTKRGLGAEGFTVDGTDDGQAGLHRAVDQQYDLVILDRVQLRREADPAFETSVR